MATNERLDALYLEVHETEKELRAQKARSQDLSKQRKELIEGLDEAQDLWEAQNDVERLRAVLADKIKNLPQVSELSDQIAEAGFMARDARERLSAHLREYQDLTGNDTIRAADNEMHQIITEIKTRLGKKIKPEQGALPMEVDGPNQTVEALIDELGVPGATVQRAA